MAFHGIACQEWNLAFQLRQIKRFPGKEIEVIGISVRRSTVQHELVGQGRQFSP